MSTYQLSEDQVSSLQRDYPSVAMQTEGGGMSFAPPTPEGDRRSGYAFGLYQFDAGANPSARKFLSQNVFENNPDLLMALEGSAASASQVTTADQMLQSAMQNQSVLLCFLGQSSHDGLQGIVGLSSQQYGRDQMLKCCERIGAKDAFSSVEAFELGCCRTDQGVQIIAKDFGCKVLHDSLLR